MPYASRTRGQILYISILLGFGALVAVREVLDHHRNSARLAAFRTDPACVAPLAISQPAQSALCHDASAVVTARWSKRRYKKHHPDYYLALRLPDGFVDTLRLVGVGSSWRQPLVIAPSSWDASSPGSTFLVRQFAPKDWAHAHVIALAGNGVTAWTPGHPVWRDGPSELLVMGASIVGLGAILLLILAVYGREEVQEEPPAHIRAA